MSIRPEVARLRAFAPLPPEQDCTSDFLEALSATIEALPSPLTQEEADALVDVLATPYESSYFGLIFGVRSAIESAPGIPAAIRHREGPWVDAMRELAQESGIDPPHLETS